MDRKSLERLAKKIQHCQKCERSQARTHAVPGEGYPNSGMLLVGEAPGKKEDHTGQPFVGRAGDYLNKILSSYNLDRNQVFITSVLKCYHPRPPKKQQIKKCLPWSHHQIEALNTKLILVMGRWAAWAFLGIQKLEGIPKVLSWKGINCVVACHPAAAMRFPHRDREFREGFKIFVARAAEMDLRPFP
ncbi:MAG: uracil-DNA glycosylase [Candidatus Aminicenantes bacterium]